MVLVLLSPILVYNQGGRCSIYSLSSWRVSRFEVNLNINPMQNEENRKAFSSHQLWHTPFGGANLPLTWRVTSLQPHFSRVILWWGCHIWIIDVHLHIRVSVEWALKVNLGPKALLLPLSLSLKAHISQTHEPKNLGPNRAIISDLILKKCNF